MQKKTIWGGSVLDKRGISMLEFMNRSNLCLINRDATLPTFETVNGTSWIDPTVVTPSHVFDWEVVDQQNSSDHKYIKVELFNITKEKVKGLTKMGKKEFWLNLQKTNGLMTLSIEMDIKLELENTIDIFYAKI